MATNDIREPAVYVNVEDRSYIGPPTETGRIVFGVILCDKGPDNRIVTVKSQKEYQKLFGAPNIKKCSQTHYMLNKALEYTGTVLACRVMPTDANIANTCITFVSSGSTVLGGSTYTFTNDLYNSYGERYFSEDSDTSIVVGTGSKTLVVDTGLDDELDTGVEVKIIRRITTAPFKQYLTYMIGTVTSYNTGTGDLVVNVTDPSIDPDETSTTFDSWSVTLTSQFDNDYIYGAMTCTIEDKENNYIEAGMWIHATIDNESLSRQIVSLTTEATGTAGGGCCGDTPVEGAFCLALLDQMYEGTEITGNACRYIPYSVTHSNNINSPSEISESDAFVYHFYANGAGEYYNNISIKCTRNYEMEKMFTDLNGVPYYPYVFVDLFVYHTDENNTSSLVEGPWLVCLVQRTPNGEVIRDSQGGLPTYIEDVVNQNSSFIRVKTGTQLDDLSGTGADAENKRLQLMLTLVREDVIASTNVGSDGFYLENGDSGSGLYNDTTGRIEPSNLLYGRIANAYSGSLTSIDGTIEMITEAIYPMYLFDYMVTGGYPVSVQYAGARLAASREDCHHLADTGLNYNSYTYDIQARQQICPWNFWTSSLYTQYRYMFDDYTGSSFWMTPVYHAMECHLKTDNNYFIAEPACNIEKGAIGDAVKLSYHTNHTVRGDLCDRELNYTISESNGVYFATQFTTWKRFQALKRQHVAKFVSYLKVKLPIILRDIIQRKATQYWLSQAQYRVNNFLSKYMDGSASDRYTCINSFNVNIEFDRSRSELNVYVTFVPILAIERINVFLTIPADL